VKRLRAYRSTWLARANLHRVNAAEISEVSIDIMHGELCMMGRKTVVTVYGTIPGFIANRREPQSKLRQDRWCSAKDLIPVAILFERSDEQTENQFITREACMGVGRGQNRDFSTPTAR
jgi:hypothetical protein